MSDAISHRSTLPAAARCTCHEQSKPQCHCGEPLWSRRAAGRFLAAPDGPRVAVLESTGWDTHANQGAATGQLANRLQGLDRGLEALAGALGPAWADTAVLVVTEFGRTVAVNGTNGTDHGTASCAFLLGGAVAGGRGRSPTGPGSLSATSRTAGTCGPRWICDVCSKAYCTITWVLPRANWRTAYFPAAAQPRH
ncbi:MAG: DUF1501 domain-containing protein [Chromatiales bacterium]|nr:MAG: DUF1501 domain-containing protein [Chromatiales bacterium]